jgi:hypothetical protein
MSTHHVKASATGTLPAPHRRHGLLQATLLGVTVLLLAGCSCGDSLVTGQCAPGFAPADGRCAPVDAGVLTDGALRDGTTDATRDTGSDAPLDDGNVPDDGGMPDGTVPDSSVTDGSMPDAMMGCGVGTLDCDGVCVRPDIDRDHCGDCDTVCPMGDICVAGLCAPSCPMRRGPSVRRAAWISPATPTTAGCAARSAAQTSARLSQCEQGAPGSPDPHRSRLPQVQQEHEPRRGQRRVHGPGTNRQRGDLRRRRDGPVPRGRQRRHRRGGRTARGRTWAGTSAMAGTVSYLLASADVFLIYPQRTGTNATLAALGEQWQTALSQFLARGGIVVAFDGVAIHDGTWQILQGAGLFQADGPTTIVPDSLMTVTLPVDSVVLGVPIKYTALANTVWFNTTDPNVVVRHPDGPVGDPPGLRPGLNPTRPW